jgi:hypothetical protein
MAIGTPELQAERRSAARLRRENKTGASGRTFCPVRKVRPKRGAKPLILLG